MPIVTYITPDGAEHSIEAEEGDSIMQTALNRGIDGIIGECGGAQMCATCHCYIENADTVTLPEMSEMESDLLDGAAAPRGQTSRLSCQLNVSESLEGIIVRIPDVQ